MEALKRDHKKKSGSMTLLIAVEKTVEDVDGFISFLKILKKRFSIKPVLVIKKPEFLFFNSHLLDYTVKSVFDRIVITDRPELFWFDFIEFGKRQETDNLLIAKYNDITPNWLSVIEFIVKFNEANFSSVISRCNKFSLLTQSKLRKIKTMDVIDFDDLQSVLLGTYLEETSKTSGTPVVNNSLFVTKEGVDRFGGIEKFKTIDLKIGGLKPNQYRKIWVIDNSLNLTTFLKNKENYHNSNIVPIPGFLLDKNDKQIIVDINPAFQTLENVNNLELSVPRSLLSISSLKEIAHIDIKSEPVFIMSNYNKASYIAASLYSIVMQTNQKINVHIVDDISNDLSEKIIAKFKKLVDEKTIKIEFTKNEKNLGTYWIRNSIIHKYIDDDVTYFVNDSDDYSSAQRTVIQLSMQKYYDKSDICFGDIVRVDKNFKLIALDGKVERYGTASLSSHVKTHKKYGYYENIKKNADTEFIERVRYFGNTSKTKWFRYPVLFQPFDGNNLTVDIYNVSLSNNAMSSNMGKRDIHKKLFLENFSKIQNEVHLNYTFPQYKYTEEYKTLLGDFLISSSENNDN